MVIDYILSIICLKIRAQQCQYIYIDYMVINCSSQRLDNAAKLTKKPTTHSILHLVQHVLLFPKLPAMTHPRQTNAGCVDWL